MNKLGQIENNIRSGLFFGLSSKEELLYVYSLPLPQLVELAMAVRAKRKQGGAGSDCCASGYLPHNGGRGCEMSCGFCGFPQSIYQWNPQQFVSKLTEGAIIEDAKKKKEMGATRYKIVSLGCSIRDDEYEIAIKALPKLYGLGFEKICLSFGILSDDRIRGLVNKFGKEKIEINHNLEVGTPELYEKLIGNDKLLWMARYNTISNAKKYGLSVCSGGLVGIGETVNDQTELVLALRSLDVSSSPFNVFVMDKNDKSAIAEKIREGQIKRPSDEELLRILCMWRLGMPKASIAVNSGYGITREGDFGIYSGIIELALINDKVSLPNQGILSKRRY